MEKNVISIEDICHQSFKALSLLELSICDCLRAITTLLEAMKKESIVYRFKKIERHESKVYLITWLHSLSDIQKILIRKIQIYIDYFNKFDLHPYSNLPTDIACYHTIKAHIKKIKSQQSLMYDHWESLFPVLQNISGYYRMKENLLGVNIIQKAKPSVPWFSKKLLKNKRKYRKNRK